MKVLLINRNPVVSRLFTLCQQSTDFELYESDLLGHDEHAACDLMFVDDSIDKELIGVSALMHQEIPKVWLSYEKERNEVFSYTIHKPFLPAQIVHMIERVQSSLPMSDTNEETYGLVEDEPVNFDHLLSEEASMFDEMTQSVLDGDEIEKIRAILDNDEEIDNVGVLSTEEIDLRKVEVIKEQLISEGVEIVAEEEIFEVIEPQVSSEKMAKNKKKKKAKKEKAILACTPKELSQIEAAVSKAFLQLKSGKLKKLLSGEEVAINLKLEDES